MVAIPHWLGWELLVVQDLDRIKDFLVLRVSELWLTPPWTWPFWKNSIVPALRTWEIRSSVYGMEDFLREIFKEDISLANIEWFEDSSYIISLSWDKLVFTKEAEEMWDLIAVQWVIDWWRNNIESTLDLPEWVPELWISELLYPIFSWNWSNEEFNDFIAALRTETKQLHPQNCIIYLLNLLQSTFWKKLSAGFEVDYKTKMIRVGNSWYDLVRWDHWLEIQYNPQLPDWCNDESDAYTIIKRAVFFEWNTHSTETLQTLFDFLEPRIGQPADNNVLLWRLFQEISATWDFMPNNIVKIEISSDDWELGLKVTTRDFSNSEEGFGPYGAERYHYVTLNTEIDYLDTDINSYSLSDTLNAADKEVFFFATPTVMNGKEVDSDDQFTEAKFQTFAERLCQLHEDEDIPNVIALFLQATLMRMRECCGDDRLELRDISVLPFWYNYKVFIDGRWFQYISLDWTDIRIASIWV